MNVDWRITITRSLLKELKRRGIASRIIGKLRELNQALDRESKRTLEVFMREPIIFEIEGFKVRRLRIGDYRLFYIIDHERKLIIFFDIKPREKAYRRR